MKDLELLLSKRPKRADARKNYDALIAAARVAFAEGGTHVPLEDIARRAGVGIATLYRNFPNREDLIESVYVDEVLAVHEYAEKVGHLDPWTALTTWLQRFVQYIGTKYALIEGLNRESDMFKGCRNAAYHAGEPLLTRAQQAGMVRKDVTIEEVVRLIGGIASVKYNSDAQRDHVISIALDGLRVHA